MDRSKLPWACWASARLKYAQATSLPVHRPEEMARVQAATAGGLLTSRHSETSSALTGTAENAAKATKTETKDSRRRMFYSRAGRYSHFLQMLGTFAAINRR